VWDATVSWANRFVRENKDLIYDENFNQIKGRGHTQEAPICTTSESLWAKSKTWFWMELRDQADALRTNPIRANTNTR
jgi:hypothetical protein